MPRKFLSDSLYMWVCGAAPGTSPTHTYIKMPLKINGAHIFLSLSQMLLFLRGWFEFLYVLSYHVGPTKSVGHWIGFHLAWSAYSFTVTRSQHAFVILLVFFVPFRFHCCVPHTRCSPFIYFNIVSTATAASHVLTTHAHFKLCIFLIMCS